MEKKENKEIFNIFYLIILIISLILVLLIFFKIGEGMYYFLNTNLGMKESISNTEIANWSFIVRIEY